MKRRWKGRNGNTYIQRKGYVFEKTTKEYKDGVLVERTMWRATVTIDGRSLWKASHSREVCEKWLKTVLEIYGRKKVVEYAKREQPVRIKAKYKPPVRVRADAE